MGTNRKELEALLARVREATGPDRELDCLIAVAVAGFFTLPERFDGDGIRYGKFDDDGTELHPGNAPDMLVPDYSDSIDAALGLVEKADTVDEAAMTILEDAVQFVAQNGWPHGRLNEYLARAVVAMHITALIAEGKDDE